jgi:LmbE family N-acetylglucosaminyl deacetylase
VLRYVIPADIEGACIGMVAHAISQGQRSGVSSMSIGEYSITFDRAGIPATILTTLRRYARA